MKVGEYARTKNCNMPSLIGKITKEEYMTPCNAEHKYIYLIDDTKDNLWFEEDNILKSSPNIIDLIEENDYIRTINDTDFRRVYMSYGKLVIEKHGLELSIKKLKLAEVITSQQFPQMKYKVESEVN